MNTIYTSISILIASNQTFMLIKIYMEIASR